MIFGVLIVSAFLWLMMAIETVHEELQRKKSARSWAFVLIASVLTSVYAFSAVWEWYR